MRKSEGVSYFDGPTMSSKVIREDTDYLLPFTVNVSSSGNQMLIKYFSDIEVARVYGVLLHFYCIPNDIPMENKTKSSKPDLSDEDCFTEDNTLSHAFRSWRIPGFGDKYYKEHEPRMKWNKLPHFERLKKIKADDFSSKKIRMPQFIPKLDFKYLYQTTIL